MNYVSCNNRKQHGSLGLAQQILTSLYLTTEDTKWLMEQYHTNSIGREGYTSKISRKQSCYIKKWFKVGSTKVTWRYSSEAVSSSSQILYGMKKQEKNEWKPSKTQESEPPKAAQNPREHIKIKRNEINGLYVQNGIYILECKEPFHLWLEELEAGPHNPAYCTYPAACWSNVWYDDQVTGSGLDNKVLSNEDIFLSEHWVLCESHRSTGPFSGQFQLRMWYMPQLVVCNCGYLSVLILYLKVTTKWPHTLVELCPYYSAQIARSSKLSCLCTSSDPQKRVSCNTFALYALHYMQGHGVLPLGTRIASNKDQVIGDLQPDYQSKLDDREQNEK